MGFLRTFEVMKNWKQFLVPIVFLQLFLIAAGSSSFASNPGLIANNLQNGKQYKTTGTQKIFFFEEPESFSPSQNLLDKEGSSFHSGIASQIPAEIPSISQAEKLQNNRLPDRKSVLSRSIFPFHFFW
ncbi:MAG: hypothetical protein ABGW97_10690 [Christiangramia sp.]|uniref:hypothetical protein n=1 Tax=Christiangramia sp. TaxID=1931228 RepID=UPI0032420DDE